MSRKRLLIVAILINWPLASLSQTDHIKQRSVRPFKASSYPAAAWIARVQGTVNPEITINSEGKRRLS